jgi:hypothetical protein
MKILRFFKKNKINKSLSKKECLNKKFFFDTKFSYGEDFIFDKAINYKGEFVWIRRGDLPHIEDNQAFYLTIIKDLNTICLPKMISSSFNLFRSRKDFYDQFTFVKEIKKHEQKSNFACVGFGGCSNSYIRYDQNYIKRMDLVLR